MSTVLEPSNIRCGAAGTPAQRILLEGVPWEPYRRSPASRLLPELDVDLLARHVRMPDQYDAVRAFRRAIAG